MSETLQLPPAVAGVTLLSFAGGAPDLFTQLAAVCTGQPSISCCTCPFAAFLMAAAPQLSHLLLHAYHPAA